MILNETGKAKYPMSKYPRYVMVNLDKPQVRRRSAIWACVITLIVGILLGQFWSLYQRRCNAKIIPDNCVSYCKEGKYLERVGE